MAFLGRAMQNIAQQAFPGGTGGMRALPATSGIGRLLGGLAGGVAAGGGSVSQPPIGAPAQTVGARGVVAPASLQPGTGGVLGQLSRMLGTMGPTGGAPTQAPPTHSALLDALRGLGGVGGAGAGVLTGGIGDMPQSFRAGGASPFTRPGLPFSRSVMGLTGVL